jgi:predicted double-glycine peptidase
MIGNRGWANASTYGRALARGAGAAIVAVGMVAAGGTPAGAASQGTTPRRSVAVAPSGSASSVGYLAHIWQTYNNCGPASVVEVLSYWGVYQTQYQAQLVLRADNNPRGMWPYGVPGYARSVGVRALVGVAGTPRLVKALVSNGFPVIVNQLYSATDSTRHYRPIQSYDDRQGVFVSSDPFGGAGYAITYADFNKIWAVANNRFMVLYPSSKALLLDAVLASAGWDRTRAYRSDLVKTEARLRSGKAPATSVAATPGAFRSYSYLNLAWDDVELGRYTDARARLRQATAHGANSIMVNWIAGEIPAR